MESKSKVDCSICCQSFKSFSKSDKKFVECLCCNNKNENGIPQIVCTSCVRRYLISSPIEAHCMFCRKKWSMTFLKRVLPQNWIQNEYKKHQRQLCLDREKSLIPETLEDAAKESILRQKEANVTTMKEKLRLEVAQLSKELEHKKRALDGHYRELSIIKNERERLCRLDSQHHVSEVAQTHYLVPCSQTDCKGMISQSNYKCVLCQTLVCKMCFQISSETHICDETDLKSALEILKNTKPCPICATRIFKITGCDQMFCTQCKTPFSWNQGTVIKGAIHNPHYFDWLNEIRNQQNHVDINLDCDLVTFDNQKRFIQNYLSTQQYRVNSFFWAILRTLYCYICGLEEDVRRFQSQIPSDGKFREKRISFILNSISETLYSSWILKSNRKKNSHITVIEIYNNFIQMATERLVVMCQFALKPDHSDAFESTKNEIEKLRCLANHSIQDELESIGYQPIPQLISWDISRPRQSVRKEW